MEDIIKFRIFLSFPLVGLLIPDLGLFLTGAAASAMPVTHLIITVTLLICIAVLSIGIIYYKRKAEVLNAANSVNNTPAFDM